MPALTDFSDYGQFSLFDSDDPLSCGRDELLARVNTINNSLAELSWEIKVVNKLDGGNVEGTWMPLFVETDTKSVYLDIDDFKRIDELDMSVALALQIERVKTFNLHLNNASYLVGLSSSNSTKVSDLAVLPSVQSGWPYAPYFDDSLRHHLSSELKKLQQNNLHSIAPKDIGFIPGNKKDAYQKRSGFDLENVKDFIHTEKIIVLSKVYPKINYTSLIANSGYEEDELFGLKANLRVIEWFREHVKTKIDVGKVPYSEVNDLVDKYLEYIDVLDSLLNKVVSIPEDKIARFNVLSLIESLPVFSELAAGSDDYNEILKNNGLFLRDELRDNVTRIGLFADLLYDVEYCSWPNSIPEWHKRLRVQKLNDSEYRLVSRGNFAFRTDESPVLRSREEAENYAEYTFLKSFLKVLPDGAEGIGHAIFKKIGAHSLRVVKQGFVTTDEAEQYIDDHYQLLNNVLPENVLRPTVGLDQRIGTKSREGDVTEFEFADIYGIDRIVFGNQMTQQDRKSVLNAAYDSFHDLSSVLRIKPKSIGLEGSLSLSFGARGQGGRGAPKAHYEPGQKVINLTKQSGLGSLAHEWFHALDHHVGSKLLKQPIAYASNIALSKFSEEPESELEQCAKAIVVAVNKAKSYKITSTVDLLNQEIENCASDVNRVVRLLDRSLVNLRSERGFIEKPDGWDAFVTEAQNLNNSNIKSFPSEVLELMSKFYENLSPSFNDVIPEHLIFSRRIQDELITVALNGVRTVKEVSRLPAKTQDIALESRYLTASRRQDKLDNRVYWSKNIELGARYFEACIKNTLEKDNKTNPYLVSYNNSPLLITKKEFNQLSQHYEQLVNTIANLLSPSSENGITNNITNIQSQVVDHSNLRKDIGPIADKLEQINDDVVMKKKQERLESIRRMISPRP